MCNHVIINQSAPATAWKTHYGEKYMSDNATKEFSISVLEGPSFTFAQAYFTWKRITDRALEAVGLTHTQYIFMATLFELGKLQTLATQNDLARLTNSDVTMTLN
jgi:hypothetical protein